MSALEKYLPTVIGVPVLLVSAYLLWPESEPAPPAERATGALVPTDFGDPDDAGDDAEGQDQAATDAADLRAARPEGIGEYVAPQKRDAPERREIVAKPQWERGAPSPASLREYSRQDPAVVEALSAVDIQVYSPPEDENGQLAQDFFQREGLTVRQHDTSEAMAQEKARRLSGSRDGLTLVVDGKVLRGFSEEQLQGALTEAVRRRVEASER